METLGWNHMVKALGQTPAYAATTRNLALNQGFYNAGLAGLLLWALFTGQSATVAAVLLTIVVMAVVGAVSASPRIFIIQGVPALLAFDDMPLSQWQWSTRLSVHRQRRRVPESGCP